MTTLELTINSRGKFYNIDVSDWDVEKWEEWHNTTETWGHDEWFKFTRYLDSVNNDVWDAIHHCHTTIKFMGKTPVGFCDRAMTLLGYPSIYSNNALVVATINYDMLIDFLKSELSEKHYEVVKEDSTNIYYLVKR